MYDDDYDPSDWQDEDPTENIIECPACGGGVYDDSPRCPLCGEYFSDSRRPNSGVAGWKYYFVIAIIVLTVVSFALPYIMSLLQLGN